MLYEQAFSEEAQSSSSNVDCEVFGTASGSQMNKTNPKLNKRNGSKDSDSVHWTDQLIRCLLDCRLSKETQFINPSCKKIKLWRQIAAEVSNTAGITVSGEMCDIKYRNLLNTYRVNKKKQSTSGEGAIRWEYLQLFDTVLGSKASSLPPKENIGDSLDSEEESIEKQNNPDTVGTTTDNNPVALNSQEDENKKNMKRKAGLSIQQYLFQKRQRDEAKEKQNEEKMRWERQKWEEQKEIKQQEINAVLKLAEALAQKK